MKMIPRFEESTVRLDTPLLLPGIEDTRDRCLERLEKALQDLPGIRRVHLKREVNPIKLCLHYDPNLVSISDLSRIAREVGARIIDRYHHRVLQVEGMDCSDCALVIEHSISRLEGVLSASVNYAAQTLQVEYDSYQTTQRAIERRVAGLGYKIPSQGMRSWYQNNRRLIISLSAGMALSFGWVGARFLGFPFTLSLVLYMAAYLLAGLDVLRHAIGALKALHFNTDILMIVAALGAAALGDFAEGALLLFLFSLGHALEERSLNRARKAIQALAELAPKTAMIRRGDSEVEVSVDSVEIGDIVIVLPGVRLPVDGKITAGYSVVNQAPVTGESVPVEVGPGNQVFAGSVNGEGALQVQVTRLARDSTLARVIKMVERAQAQKAPTQQITERFTRVFVPVVLIVDVLLIAVPPLFGVPFAESFRMAMTLLVAASPCALALGTPAAVLAGIARAARNGVLIKGGIHLENLGLLKAIAFDKTGTITHGNLEVTDIVVLDPVRQQADILRLAAAVEGRSAHPLAQAVVRAAEERGLPIPEIAGGISMTGRGAKGLVEGVPVWVGSPDMFKAGDPPEDGEIPILMDTRSRLVELESQGKTTIIVGQRNKVIGLIAMTDQLRQGVNEQLSALKALGIDRAIMLTGDNARVAGYIAARAGLSDYLANLMPDDKADAIQRLVAEHGHVGMVGDGVNDAPALAQATVGIAMGGVATDVALETADVALLAEDLSRLPFAVGLGRATQAIIRQNLILSAGVIVGLTVLALSGLAGIGFAILLHEGSTLLVVMNSMRLLNYRPRLVV